MATTYVYASTSIDVPVQLSLQELGPQSSGSKLDRTSLPAKSGSSLQIAEVPRAIGSGIYSIDLPFKLQQPESDYLASLQIMLRGHGLGSMIWWRWKAPAALTGEWVTDHDPHQVIRPQALKRYAFTIQGVGAVGYDDINVTLGLV